MAIQRNQQKALTLKYSCSRALSAVILFLGSYVRNLKIQKRKLHSLQITCISSLHSLTSPGSGSPLFPLGSPIAFYHLSFFPMKEPGPRDPFLESPANFRAPKSYTQIQALVLLNKPVNFDNFPSLREHPVFSALLSPAFGGREATTGNTSAVRRLQLQLSRSTDYRDLRDTARWLSFAKLQIIYM